MALAKVLAVLPVSATHRSAYVADLRRTAAGVVGLQRNDGFWNVNLGDPSDHPGPESSATALFAYALGWGVRSGLLDPTAYRPAALRAWRALVGTALSPDGRLGYVQGPAVNPAGGQPVTASSTQNFAVGAFLLAVTEIAAI
jgi:rhamnogalacturonyl hydrolase YesR